MEEKRKVTLNLTQEQYTILSAFVNFNQWDFDSMVVENGWEISENLQAESVNAFTADTSDTHEGQHEEIVPGENEFDGNVDHPGENANGNARECELCFCTPCVTTNRQSWLGNGSRPHIRNSALRKSKYRKFWTMLSGMAAWHHPRYIEKKTRMLQTQNARDLGEIYTLREIMPDCVLRLVRRLYPNIPGHPYMGHRWS